MDLDRILELTDSAEILAAVEECRTAKRAADQSHRERIHAEIEADLLRAAPTYFDDIIRAIAAGRIRHLTINY